MVEKYPLLANFTHLVGEVMVMAVLLLPFCWQTLLGVLLYIRRGTPFLKQADSLQQQFY
jgi:hypothetical protein